MLILSLALSCILLVVATVAVSRASHPVWTVVLTAVGLTVCSCGIGFFSVAFVVTAAVLALAVAVCSIPSRRSLRFLALGPGALVAVYGVVSGLAYWDIHNLKREFPYVSVEQRVRRPTAPEVLLQTTADRLADLEDGIELANQRSLGHMRVAALRRLHEETVQVFVNQPGFGVARMTGVEGWVRRGLRHEPPVPQPGPRTTPLLSSGVLHQEVPSGHAASIRDSLSEMHRDGLLDFLNVGGFGYFKDRRHVAGFQEHQMSHVPTAASAWVLETVDLIGLAMHDEPVAYMSDHLPRMDELREAPTRLLDEFEANGLAALRRGDDLYVRDTFAGRRRALGSIRSAKQCVECHGGERGALLGALSYTLRQRDADQNESKGFPDN